MHVMQYRNSSVKFICYKYHLNTQTSTELTVLSFREGTGPLGLPKRNDYHVKQESTILFNAHSPLMRVKESVGTFNHSTNSTTFK